MSDVAAAFVDAPALITYVVAGDPDADSTKAYVEALARGGADVIELGLPFSEPIAEGPTIQAGILRALEAGMTPSRFFELADELSDAVDTPLVVMTYYNLIYQYGDDEGVEPFVEAAAGAGLSGVIPASSERTMAFWMVVPSAIGSENGSPSSIASAPPAASASTYSMESS